MDDNRPTLLVDSAHCWARARYTTGLRIDNGVLYGYIRMVSAVEAKIGARTVHHCLEGGGSRARRKQLPSYKADRPLHDFGDQDQRAGMIDWALLSGHNVSRGEECEADDVMVMLAADVVGSVIIMTGDRDLRACLEDGRVEIITELSKPRVTEAWLRDKVGVRPRDHWKMKALMGDPGDGVPGIKGVGPAAAKKIGDSCDWDWDVMLDHPRVTGHIDVVKAAALAVSPRTGKLTIETADRDDVGLEDFYSRWSFTSLMRSRVA